MHHWFDNFHTGYNLDSLKRYIEATGDMTFAEHLKKGYSFFKENFFEESGCPKYYHNRTYPIDSQCASQAIDTLVMFSEGDPESLKLAKKVAFWTINNMQAKDGHFYYRIYPGGLKAKTPMLHWGQATMYKALTNLFAKFTSIKQ
jgi:rhamnogalacturonyl hydrolase YesR